MNYCTNCGYKISEKDNYCTNCGRQLKNTNDTNEFIDNSEDDFLNKTIYSKKENKIVNNIVLASLLLLITLSVFGFFEETTSKKGAVTGWTPAINENIIKEDENFYSNNIIYKNESAGIYAFKILPDDFKKDDFLKYVQTLPRSAQGDSSFVFVFDKNLLPKSDYVIEQLINNNKIPMYTTDILWKQYPYFYYSDAFGLKQFYCEINGLHQKYYERNQALLFKETDFSYKYNLTAPSFWGLSSLNGCNPEYVQNDFTTQQEMELGAIFRVNLQ